MKLTDRDAIVVLALIAALAACFWIAEVRANDKRLMDVAACADSAGADNQDEWKVAWDACWPARGKRQLGVRRD